MATGFNLTALAAYVKDNEQKLITAALASAPTLNILSSEGQLMPGIKTSERIGVLDTDAILQDGDGCGFTPDGQTRITHREIAVKPIKVNEEYCLDDLSKKYTQLMMQKGSYPEKFPAPIEEAFTDQKRKKIGLALEQLLWKGDTTLTGTQLVFFDGLLKIADNTVGAKAVNVKKGTGTITAATNSTSVTGSGTSFTTQVAVGDKIYTAAGVLGTVASITNDTTLVLSANSAFAGSGVAFKVLPSNSQYFAAPVTAATGITAANVISVFDAVVASFPEAVINGEDKPVIFAGVDLVRMYATALRNANLYHYTASGDEYEKGFVIPGTDIRVIPTPGLSGTNRLFGTRLENIWLGTDLENEWETFKWYYDERTETLLFKSRFRLGVQIAFPSEAVQFLLA